MFAIWWRYFSQLCRIIVIRTLVAAQQAVVLTVRDGSPAAADCKHRRRPPSALLLLLRLAATARSARPGQRSQVRAGEVEEVFVSRLRVTEHDEARPNAE
eukprot:3181251-Pyramimonas_sp.AAC.1